VYDVEGKIMFKFSSTPKTIEREIGSTEGSIVGWSFERPIPFKVSMFNIGKAVMTEEKDIYKCGQWAYSPAGIPTCILTGKIAANKAIKGFR
jgi:phytoene dehydrogenase-like protein